MELKLSARRVLILLAAVGAVLALALATALTGANAKAATRHHRHAAHHTQRARTAARTSTSDTADAPGGNVQSGNQSGANDPTGADTETTSSEGEKTSTETDGPGGPNAGGDHQCPPACSPGEQG